MPSRTLALYLGCFAMLAGTLAVDQFLSHRPASVLAAPLGTVPAALAGWETNGDRTLEPEVLQVLRPHSYLSRNYRRGREQLDLLVAYYGRQTSGEGPHSPKNCLPGSGWEIWDSGTAEVHTSTGTYTVARYGVQKQTTRLQVLYWYQSPRRIIASEFKGKLFLLYDSLIGRDASDSLVRVTVADSAPALAAGLQFAAELIPQVQACIRPRHETLIGQATLPR